MTEENLLENCKDEYNRDVRLVQLIGSPALSRLEIIIFTPYTSSGGSKQKTPIRPSAYYKIISNPSALSTTNQNLGQTMPKNTRYIPNLRITYDDNSAGWCVPETFGSIEQYLLQRLHELTFVGSNKKVLNGKNILDGVKSFDRNPFLKASLTLFKAYCYRKGYTYEKRNPPEEIDIQSCRGNGPYTPPPGGPWRP